MLAVICYSHYFSNKFSFINFSELSTDKLLVIETVASINKSVTLFISKSVFILRAAAIWDSLNLRTTSKIAGVFVIVGMSMGLWVIFSTLLVYIIHPASLILIPMPGILIYSQDPF